MAFLKSCRIYGRLRRLKLGRDQGIEVSWKGIGTLLTFKQWLTRGGGKNYSYLEGLEGTVADDVGMRKIALDHSKDLFKWEPRPNINLRSDFYSEAEKVSTVENNKLEARFSEEEIKNAVFSPYSDGAHGPDGLPFMFFQEYWEIVKEDLINMFNAWFDGDLDIFRLKFSMITLIPK